MRFLHLLLDPPVGGEVRDVGLFDRTSTRDEQPNNPAHRVDHYGARVAGSRKGAVGVAVKVDGDLDGRLRLEVELALRVRMHLEDKVGR